MFVQSPPLGKLGILPDQPGSLIPVGGWSIAFNLRFNDDYMEVIREPTLFEAYPVGFVGKWGEVYTDNVGPRMIVAGRNTANTGDSIYILDLVGGSWTDVTNSSYATGYTPNGNWQSFQWGQAVVFNNGLDTPQILLPGALEMTDLANWGLVGGVQTTMTAKVIRPFRNLMMAIDIETDGNRNENEVIWSDPAYIDNDANFDFEPPWDYLDPTTLAGRNFIGVDQGPLLDLLSIGNRMMLYTGRSSHYAIPIGGNSVFKFDDAPFEYGIVSTGAVTRFGNQHFVVSPKTMYVHDGQRVRLVGEGRIDNTFYQGSIRENADNIYVEENVDRKEIHIIYNGVDPDLGVAPTAIGEQRQYLIYNYKDDNWSIGQAEAEGSQCVHMRFDVAFDSGEAGTSWDSLDASATTWDDLNSTTWNDFNGEGGLSTGRVMWWFHQDGVWKAEQDNRRDTRKTYIADTWAADFSELNPSLTSNLQKHVAQIIPKIDSAFVGSTPADCEFRIRWQDNLYDLSPIGEVIEPFSPSANDYKVDTRITGRWLNLRVSVTGDGDWRMAAMDYDMEPLYGR